MVRRFGINVLGSPGVRELERARNGLQQGDYSSVLQLSRMAMMAAQSAVQQAEREVARRRIAAEHAAEADAGVAPPNAVSALVAEELPLEDHSAVDHSAGADHSVAAVRQVVDIPQGAAPAFHAPVGKTSHSDSGCRAPPNCK